MKQVKWYEALLVRTKDESGGSDEEHKVATVITR
jgi:hypothetical protein